MSLQVIESKVIFMTLQSLLAYAPADLLNSAGQVKAYHKAVPEDVALPYIVYSRIAGGNKNDSYRSHSDSLYRIVAVTADWENVDTYEEFIYRLHRTMPLATGLTGVEPFHYFEEIVPVMDTTKPQNITIWQVGGHYKLMLSYT